MDIKRCLPAAFGDYCPVTCLETDNSMSACTVGCIALLPLANYTSSMKFLNLYTMRTITGDQFVVVPTTAEVCMKMNLLANNTKHVTSGDLVFEYNWNAVADRLTDEEDERVMSAYRERST